MEAHALAILDAAELWDWPLTHCIQASGSRSGKLRAITPKLLSCFIHESQALGGTLVDQFWDVVGRCHLKLAENSVSNILLHEHAPLFIFSAITLKDTPFFSMHHSEAVLFEGINRNSVDFDPIYQLAAELFTHLCIACGSYHRCPETLTANLLDLRNTSYESGGTQIWQRYILLGQRHCLHANRRAVPDSYRRGFRGQEASSS